MCRHSEGEGPGSQPVGVIFRGAEESRGDKPQQLLAAEIRAGTWPMGHAPVACAELLRGCMDSATSWGAWLRWSHVPPSQDQTLLACLHPSKIAAIFGAKVCRVEMTVPDGRHTNSVGHLFLFWAPGAQQPSLLPVDTAHSHPLVAQVLQHLRRCLGLQRRTGRRTGGREAVMVSLFQKCCW